ncbi:MAG: hypothetical protein AAF726_23280 [Planctomycetota bacterium]
MPDASLPRRDHDAEDVGPAVSARPDGILTVLGAHRLLWLGPPILGLLWLGVLFALSSGGGGADYTYVLS